MKYNFIRHSNPRLLDSKLVYLYIYIRFILIWLFYLAYCTLYASLFVAYSTLLVEVMVVVAQNIHISWLVLFFLLFIYLLLYKKINLINLISLKACDISINSRLYLCYFILTKVNTNLTITSE